MQDSDPDLVRPARLSPGPAGGEPPHFERIAPVALQAGPASLPSRRIDGATVSTRTLLAGVVLIAMLGLGLLVGLPALIDASGPVAAEPAAAEVVAATPVAASAAAAAPAPAAPDLAAISADPALLAARQDSQRLRQSVADSVAALQAKAVQRWGAAAFEAATAQADAAARAFDGHDYPAAARGYQGAATALDALRAEADRQRSAALKATATALAAGDAEAARAALDLALAIDPADAGALRLQQRLAAWPAVRAALQRASVAEAAGDTRAAAAAWRDALAADPEQAVARAALARLDGDQAAARFRTTMATALAALDAGRLDEAEAQLKAAAGQRPGDAGIADAEARLARARREQTLARLEAEAAAASAAEDWDTAAHRHAAVLALDPSVTSAQRGQPLAAARAALAARLDGHLRQPARLASEAVRADAAQALAEARGIRPAGPKLAARIDRLEALLAAATTPVEVRLLSDNATEVTVYRVGAQGRFSERSLRLAPGRYVAVGARPGHVDVRVEFTVEAGRVPAPVTIRCEDRL